MNHRLHRTCLVWAAWAVTLSFSAPSVRAQTAPLPPDQPAYGLTRAQWLEAFIQWFGSIPVSSSPWKDYDSDGLRAGVGQHGPVWFLPPGFLGQQGTRTITVPEGKAIYLGVLIRWRNAVPGAQTDANLLAAADLSLILPQITHIEASLDGVSVGDILSYRVQSSVFSIDLPPDNFFQQPVTVGQDSRQAFAAGGLPLIFPPLPVGTHVFSVVIEGIAGNGYPANISTGQPFKTSGTFIVKVQKPNVPLP